MGQAMPDPKLISGVPLPTNDLPAGSVSVRVIRGSFENNLPGIPVTFIVDGKTTTVKTGADGRAEIANLAPGAHLTAAADVGAEHLTSQNIVIARSGIRLVLTATDPSAAARTIRRPDAGAPDQPCPAPSRSARTHESSWTFRRTG